MSINDVINSWKEVPSLWDMTNFESMWTFGGVIIMILVFTFGICMLSDDMGDSGLLIIFMGVVGGCSIIFLGATSQYEENKEAYITNWKEEATSFVDELPENKVTELIQFIEKTPTINADVENILSAKLTSTKVLEDAEYGELKYMEDGIEKVERGWFILDFVEDGEPSYSYKEVEKDLNETIEKGAFDKTIIVPTNKYQIEGTNIIYFNK